MVIGGVSDLTAHRGVGVLVGRLLLDATHDVHAVDDVPKGGGALRIVEPLAAEIERRLVVETDEEVGGRRIGLAARAIEIVPATCVRPVTLVRSSGIGAKPSRRRAGLMPAWTMAIAGRSGGAGV